MLQNLHTHSSFCDGKNTPREIILAAIEKGFDSIGFSSHAKSEMASAEELADIDAYISCINGLKKEFEGKLQIYAGCELDYYSKGLMPLELFDYTIGSVHTVLAPDGSFIHFDLSADMTERYIKEYFDGDSLAYAKAYYEKLAHLPERFPFDFVGHFDLLTKFSEKRPDLIDFESKKYKDIAVEALYAVREHKEFFEVNTGAIARGHRTTPYPAPFLLDAMRDAKCKLILTSDCHNAKFLDCYFNEAKEYLKSHGIDVIYNLASEGFKGEKI